MEVTKEEQESKGRFVAIDGDMEAGEMTYSIANDGQLLIVDHTGVDESYKGKGVGKILFEHLVSSARAEERKVMPLCPFTRAMFKKNKDDWDVLRHNSL
ncbi:MAG: N-acetyltransferase [Ekhidna sp.]|nr:N-acetyltransferase [Ekhidna sp.]